jgi:hypothetical protein
VLASKSETNYDFLPVAPSDSDIVIIINNNNNELF